MDRNNLYPIFLKLNQLHFLIVGGGFVGHEKLYFLLKSSPDAKVTIVSKEFNIELIELAKEYDVTLIQKAYDSSDLKNKDIVIAATDKLEINKQVRLDAKQIPLLVNVADTPDLCDFYLGGIVNKGHVKIAISTNGKSPTTAKRLRQFFEEILPENISKMVENLNHYRKTLSGDFEDKVNKMNEITEELVKNREN